MATIADLMSIMDAAAADKRRRLEDEDLKRKMADEERARQAAALSYRPQADLSQLLSSYGDNPMVNQAAQMQAARANEMAMKQATMAEAQRKQQEAVNQQRAKVLRTGLRFIDTNPNSIYPVLGQLQKQLPPEMLPKSTDPQGIAQWRQQAQQIADTYAPLDAPKDDIANEMAMEHPTVPFGTQQYATLAAQIRQRQEAEKVKRAKAGASQVNVGGNAALTNSVRSEQEGKLIDEQIMLGRIQDLRDLGDPSRYLGLAPKVKKYSLGALASLSPESLTSEQRTYLEDARTFRQGVNGIMLESRRALTGVSAGVKEMEEINDALINLDMNSVEFGAALNRLEKVTNRNIAIRQRLLAKGIDLGSASGRNAMNQAIMDAQKEERSSRQTPDRINVKEQRRMFATPEEAAAADLRGEQ